jgi:diacylglycerol kinase family enzyme
MERLTIDGEAVAGRPIFAEVLNIPLTGPNLRLARETALDDGYLTVVHATEKHRQAIVDWLDAGAHPAARPALPTARAKEFTIKWAGGPLRIDDDVTGQMKGRLTISSQRVRIRLLAPP